MRGTAKDDNYIIIIIITLKYQPLNANFLYIITGLSIQPILLALSGRLTPEACQAPPQTGE